MADKFIGQQQSQRTSLTPELQQQLGQATSGLQQSTAQFLPQAQQAAGQVQTGFSSFAPRLQTQFQGPQFANQLDSRAKQIVSQGQQQLAQGAAAQQQALANQFRQQPGVARALAAQSANRAALQSNPLQFQAAQDQRGREAQEFQLSQQSQQLSNQALLAQQQEGARLQGLGNQAVAQQLGLAGAGQQAQQSLLNSLAQVGQLTGTTEERKASKFGLGGGF